MFKRKYVGVYIRTFPYEYLGVSNVGYVIYYKYFILGCLLFDRAAICIDNEYLNEAKKIIGIK